MPRGKYWYKRNRSKLGGFLSMSIDKILNDAKTKMSQSVEVLKKDYSTMRTSRATPSLP